MKTKVDSSMAHLPRAPTLRATRHWAGRERALVTGDDPVLQFWAGRWSTALCQWLSGIAVGGRLSIRRLIGFLRNCPRCWNMNQSAGAVQHSRRYSSDSKVRPSRSRSGPTFWTLSREERNTDHVGGAWTWKQLWFWLRVHAHGRGEKRAGLSGVFLRCPMAHGHLGHKHEHTRPLCFMSLIHFLGQSGLINSLISLNSFMCTFVRGVWEACTVGRMFKAASAFMKAHFLTPFVNNNYVRRAKHYTHARARAHTNDRKQTWCMAEQEQVQHCKNNRLSRILGPSHKRVGTSRTDVCVLSSL